MKDITVIIPIHDYNAEISELLKKAVASVPNKDTILFSCYDKIVDAIMKDFPQVNIVVNEKNDFCNLVNNAVNNINTKWFSILEFDDEYTPIWFEAFERYSQFKPEVSIFMPLADLFDFNEKNFLGYGNEAAWASSFSNEIGYVDNDCLSNYFDFYMTGSIFNTEDWKDYGGLKPSMKLTFWYEFMLRMTYNDKKVYVIPKVGYVHNLNRDGSLLKTYAEGITEKESNFWIETARQEQFFTSDRNKTYESSVTED